MSKKQYSLHKLSNGMRVILAPNKSTKAVTVMVGYKVGSRHEAREINGAAHFIEHLMFKGSRKYPKAIDVSRALDSLGAEFNASTGKDMTAYYVKVAGDKLEAALNILSDILIHPLFASVEIELERKVIIEELKMYKDSPPSIVSELIEELIYQGHPLARDVGGTKRTVSAISRAKLISFKKQYYSADNAVISIAGRLSGQTALRLCEKYFKRHDKRHTTNDMRLFKNSQEGSRVKLFTKQTEQVYLALGMPSLADNDPRLPTLKLLATILGGGMSSRLFTELREKRGLCYSVSASVGTFEETGDFLIRAGLDHRRINAALKLILREIRKFKTKAVSQAELQRAKDLVCGVTVLGLEHSEYVAEFYIKEVLYREEIKTPEQKLASIKRVTAGDIKALASEIFVTDKLNLALVSPLPKGKAEEFGDLLKV